ncbi:hypothetical protein BVRB_2g028010 [Beta vulgaris subsp. vulgaris]|nr:hypothetical protein BVRB_2g028010 [Beta vulgaris subsp. vulgaris]
MLRYLSFFCVFFLFSSLSTLTEARDHSNFNANITVKWDLMNWTPDGYVAVVTIYNFQEHRNIQAPGWRLGWTWAKHEVLWSTVGGQAINQGNCSHFKGNIPVSCMKTPTIVDLKPNTPYNQQIENCCRGGLLSAWSNKHRTSYISAFQVSVGQSGTSNRTVKLPKNFTFKAPRDRYTCGPAKVVRPTKFLTMDKRRTTQALMTWKITCTYSRNRGNI